MSEEDVKQGQEVPNEEALVEEHVQEEVSEHSVESTEREYSEVEREAMAKGWKPPEEFDEEGKEAVSAEAFLARGPVFDKLKKERRRYEQDLNRLEKRIEEMSYLMQEERVKGYEQALRDLESKRREAVEIGDVDAFNYVDSEYNRIKEEKARIAAQSRQYTSQTIPEAALEFQERNSDWFNSNTPENNSMVEQAVKIDDFLAKEKPYLSEEQRLARVEREIKELYPHRFSNPKKKAPAKVETSAKDSAVKSSSSNGLKIKVSDLTPSQKEAAQRFLAMDPSLTMEDYLRSVQEGLRLRNQL